MENINWKMFSFQNFNDFLHKPKHAASLAVARILFGMLMLIDIVEERGGSDLDIRWGDPKSCHFPLLPHLLRPSLPWICLFYGIMWLGALGIALGYKFKLSCALFCVPYWYVMLLDKSFWNNHSYLYGLVGLLLSTSSANSYWSIDSYLSNEKTNTVPNWNYFILKFQFFILYFYAGLKKTDMEWLEGYSMTNLGRHWVFSPFSTIFTIPEIDYFIIHITGFLLDLTLGFLLIWKKTRPISMLFGTAFHLMNSRMFSIGMFPYVCIATLPLFCESDWPIKLLSKFVYKKEIEEKKPSICYPNKKSRVILIMFYCLLQMFLPYSHFITKGFNNWTNGLYGYSWDMMVHSWDTTMVVVRIVDNKSGKEHFLDPSAWTHNDRWSKHADMCVQYAHCLKNNLLTEISNERSKQNSDLDNYITSQDISIYVDVWCSLNGRFQQRMFNPNYDLLKANWSPFKKVEWLLPLLTEYSVFREKIREIENHVYSWSNYSDVLFIADFPGLSLENFISPDLVNVTLTVIEGEVLVHTELSDKEVQLGKGSSIPIVSNVFHTIHTVGEKTSCFMYTYFNKTKDELKEQTNIVKSQYSPIPLLEDSAASIEGFVRMWDHVGNSLLNLIYEVPMIRRAPI